MLNRFSTTKNLHDLLSTIETNNVTFRTLSAEEIERINAILAANLPGVDMKVSSGVTFDKMVDMLGHIINNKKEEPSMKNGTNEIKTNINLAVEEIYAKWEQAKNNVKVKAGQTAEAFVTETDEQTNKVKEGLDTVLEFADKQLGLSMLKHNIAEILQAGGDGTTKKDLFKMADKCREQINKFINRIERYGSPETANTLKELFGLMRKEDLFTKFFSTLNWIANKVARKLRKILQIDEEKSIIGAICRSLAGFGAVIKAGVQIVWTAVKYTAAFITAGLIKLWDWVVHTFRKFAESHKDWKEKKDKVIKEDDEE